MGFRTTSDVVLPVVLDSLHEADASARYLATPRVMPWTLQVWNQSPQTSGRTLIGTSINCYDGKAPTHCA